MAQISRQIVDDRELIRVSSALLTTLLTEIDHLSDSETWWDRHPTIVITEAPEGGRFNASVMVDAAVPA